MTSLAPVLRLGDWRDVLGDVDADTLLADPPYGPRTHEGYRTAKDGGEGSIARRTGLLSYQPLTRHDVRDLVRWADAHVRRWVVLFGDDVTAGWWKRAFERRPGWYAFRPLPVIKTGACPRFSGDGPACSTEEVVVAGRADVIDAEFERIVVARRVGIADGARPGHYIVGRVEGATNGSLIVGQKPLSLMRRLVCHYSRPGDVVVDTFAGSASTLVAAAAEGRVAIGAERDPSTHAMAVARLTAGVEAAKAVRLGAPPPLDLFSGSTP